MKQEAVSKRRPPSRRAVCAMCRSFAKRAERRDVVRIKARLHTRITRELLSEVAR